MIGGGKRDGREGVEWGKGTVWVGKYKWGANAFIRAFPSIEESQGHMEGKRGRDGEEHAGEKLLRGFEI